LVFYNWHIVVQVKLFDGVSVIV